MVKDQAVGYQFVQICSSLPHIKKGNVAYLYIPWFSELAGGGSHYIRQQFPLD